MSTDLVNTLAQSSYTVPPIAYGAITPLLVVLGTACLAVLVEAFLPRHQRWPAQVALSIVGLAVAGITLGVYANSSPAEGVVTLGGSLAIDRPTLFMWGTLLVLTLGAILMIMDRSVEPGTRFCRPPVGTSWAVPGQGSGHLDDEDGHRGGLP